MYIIFTSISPWASALLYKVRKSLKHLPCRHFYNVNLTPLASHSLSSHKTGTNLSHRDSSTLTPRLSIGKKSFAGVTFGGKSSNFSVFFSILTRFTGQKQWSFFSKWSLGISLVTRRLLRILKVALKKDRARTSPFALEIFFIFLSREAPSGSLGDAR